MSGLTTLPANLAEIHRLDDDIVRELIDNIKKVLVDQDINFSRDMSRSIIPEIITGIRYVLVDSPYATVVDKGMPPGKNVNFDALKNWVEKKLNIPNEQSTEVTIKIMNKIKNEGIKPKFFMKKAIKMLIAKRGIIRVISSGSRRKIGGFERALNKVAKVMRKVNRFAKKLSRNINKVNKAIKFTGRSR